MVEWEVVVAAEVVAAEAGVNKIEIIKFDLSLRPKTDSDTMSNNYEHKVVRGVPFYKKRDTTDGILYTFDQYKEPIAIGTYDATTDGVILKSDWQQLIQQRLVEFRSGVKEVERDKLRENITKPTKSRKTTRNPRKTTKAKSAESE